MHGDLVVDEYFGVVFATRSCLLMLAECKWRFRLLKKERETLGNSVFNNLQLVMCACVRAREYVCVCMREYVCVCMGEYVCV